MVSKTPANPVAAPDRLRVQRGRRRLTPLLFVLPAVVVLIAVNIFPFLYSLRNSTLDWEMTVPAPPRFIFLGNYAQALFADGRFWNAAGNTAVLVVAGVLVEFLAGTAIAWALHKLGRLRPLLVALLLLPVMIAPVIAGFQWRIILNDQYGPLNWYLAQVGLPHPAWLADPNIALFTILLTDVWQWTPFMILLILSGLQAIPTDLEEAARSDGASEWQYFWRISLPIILPVIVVSVLIRFMDIFKTFDFVAMLTGGGPGSRSETLSWYTYLQGFEFFNVGYAAALSYIQLIIITIVARVFVNNIRRLGSEGAS